MTIEFGLTDELINTQYAPLAALSVHYQEKLMLKPVEGISIPMKKRDFNASDKLVQVLLSILAGCETISEVNVRLKPEISLAKAWHWDRFADQSGLSRTLDALTLKQIGQLREAIRLIWRSNSLAVRHDWRGYLWLDFDLSGLPCGKQAEASQKDYFSGKKTSPDANWHGSAPFDTAKPSGLTCTQAINIPVHCLQPAVLAAENALELAPAQRKRTVWRLDGGAGSDEHIRWLLDRDYHLVSKGMSNRRAGTLAAQVCRWDSYGDVWLGEVAPPIDYGRPVRVFVKRKLKDGKFRHSYYVATLSLPSKGHFQACYNGRGGAEVEQFRSDKSGLSLAARRKRDFLAQKGFILLTDLAHNLLADFYHRALISTRFESYGLKRIVRDLLATPGRLVFDDGELRRVELLSLKHFASDLLICLERYCLGD